MEQMHHGKSRGERFCRNLGGKCINNRSLKAYIVLLFLDTFRNKSGKPQPIWTKVGTHTKFRERCRPLTWVKGRQRSRNFGRDRLSVGEVGGKKVSRTRVFFVGNNMRRLFGNFATAAFRQIRPRYVNRG